MFSSLGLYGAMFFVHLLKVLYIVYAFVCVMGNLGENRLFHLPLCPFYVGFAIGLMNFIQIAAFLEHISRP